MLKYLAFTDVLFYSPPAPLSLVPPFHLQVFSEVCGPLIWRLDYFQKPRSRITIDTPEQGKAAQSLSVGLSEE